MDAPTSFEFFNGFPRLPLANIPTPLIELKKLSALLKGPRIFMKREDLTGFAMGGNKVRKFEFFMAEALQRGADCCLAIGAVQSNHARMAAASALYCELKAYLLLMGDQPSDTRGNLLLDYMLGAEVTYIPTIADFEERMKVLSDLADRLQRDGNKPYVLPVTSALGCLGPMMAMEEALKQTRSMGVRMDHQFIAVGTGETLVGLTLGADLNRVTLETLGICIGRKKREMIHTLEKMGTQIRELIPENSPIGLGCSLTDDYLGKAGHPSKEGLDAIRLVAKTEGIFLDPIYTGKAMAAMLDMIQKKRFNRDENLLFWNTSSSPIFFAFDDYLC